MRPANLVNAPLTAVLVAVGLALTTPAALAQGKGGGGGGHTTASTNLSYPAVYTSTVVITNGVEGQYTLGGNLGETWSYGCAVPVEEFPNTSCIDPATNEFLDYANCQTVCGDVQVERIYWQRESPVAVWQAGSLTSQDSFPPVEATHVDWGDNMESQTWSATSVIRVETTAFATLTVNQLGFQMWHVSGKGPDELWGVRATEPAEGAAPLPHVYSSPYAILHAPNVHISFTKLEESASTCPTLPGPSPFDDLVWNPTAHQWFRPGGDGELDTYFCVWNDLKYTVELNIGGKFVHGYNWQTSRIAPMLCGTYRKEGWWRLTYHSAADAVNFLEGVVLAPPPLPDAAPPPPAVTTESEEGDTGFLYTPVVDPASDLTYIDICLKPGRGGGGRR